MGSELSSLFLNITAEGITGVKMQFSSADKIQLLLLNGKL